MRYDAAMLNIGHEKQVFVDDLVIESAENGAASLSAPFRVCLANGGGVMHGGALVTLADTAVAMDGTLEQLSADAAHPSLRTHKLCRPLVGCWACSAGYDLRIVFEYTQHAGQEAILLLAWGTHA